MYDFHYILLSQLFYCRFNIKLFGVWPFFWNSNGLFFLFAICAFSLFLKNSCRMFLFVLLFLSNAFVYCSREGTHDHYPNQWWLKESHYFQSCSIAWNNYRYRHGVFVFRIFLKIFLFLSLFLYPFIVCFKHKKRQNIHIFKLENK